MLRVLKATSQSASCWKVAADLLQMTRFRKKSDKHLRNDTLGSPNVGWIYVNLSSIFQKEL